MFRSRVPINNRDRDASQNLIMQTYRGGGWRIPELLAAYLAADDTYFDAVSRVRVPTWSRGRVVLVGDAASCVSLFGEGSSSAMASAQTLTRSLATTPHNITAALTHYESQHRRLTGRGQRAVPVVSHLLIPASRAGIALRNQALRLTGHR